MHSLKNNYGIAFLIPEAGIRVLFTGNKIQFNVFTKIWIQFPGNKFRFNAREIHFTIRVPISQTVHGINKSRNHFTTYHFRLTFYFE